jgi:hypothetical protein
MCLYVVLRYSFFLNKKADPLKQNRSQDAIIALLWRLFIETNGSDPHLLPRLPMTKVKTCELLFLVVSSNMKTIIYFEGRCTWNGHYTTISSSTGASSTRKICYQWHI